MFWMGVLVGAGGCAAVVLLVGALLLYFSTDSGLEHEYSQTKAHLQRAKSPR